MRASRGISQCEATDGSIVTFSRESSSDLDRSMMLRSISPIAWFTRCQGAALRSQFKPSRQAVEQAETELFLQPADTVADCTLREIQLVCGLGKAQVPGCHNEDPQCIK